jgi:hypothetical protein
MRTYFGIVLLIVGCMCAQASAADTPESVVRAQRAESNAAIAAHDAVRLRILFDDNYHAILGSTGNLDSGADAATRGYAALAARDNRVLSTLTPTSINANYLAVRP